MSWGKLDDGLHDHPKVLDCLDDAEQLEGPERLIGFAAVGLLALSISYCADHLTDGHLRPSAVARLSLGHQELVDWLLAHGFWQPNGNGVMVHDYLDFNPSKAKVQERQKKARERMERMRKNRAREQAKLVRANKRRTSDVPSRPVPSRVEPSGSTPPPTTSADPPMANEVGQLCELLADLIEANGSKRPTVGERWRTACRLMLERDGRTAIQVEAAIRWCQADEFWRTVVLSMPKLRDKYDQMRLQAQRAKVGSRGEARMRRQAKRAQRVEEAK